MWNFENKIKTRDLAYDKEWIQLQKCERLPHESFSKLNHRLELSNGLFYQEFYTYPHTVHTTSQQWLRGLMASFKFSEDHYLLSLTYPLPQWVRISPSITCLFNAASKQFVIRDRILFQPNPKISDVNKVVTNRLYIYCKTETFKLTSYWVRYIYSMNRGSGDSISSSSSIFSFFRKKERHHNPIELLTHLQNTRRDVQK